MTRFSKKIKINFLVILTVGLVFSLFFAQPCQGFTPGINGLLENLEEMDVGFESNLITVVKKIIDGVFGVIGVIFFVLLFYGGFIWMTAAGSTDRIATAKKIILAAVIGIAITLLSYTSAIFITDILKTAIGGSQ